ncbi:hypothetical protein R1flu_029242 [Riccia fluitans]|uniref:Uncharacterized protein n=1 Tax=Riccia fluitans TaxID=41844 RepID=A0ABD1XP09_9MARC
MLSGSCQGEDVLLLSQAGEEMAKAKRARGVRDNGMAWQQDMKRRSSGAVRRVRACMQPPPQYTSSTEILLLS